MKVIILAAGYGTRLSNDFKERGDAEEKISLSNLPKGLLPIAGKPLIDYWIDELTQLGLENQTIIVTNETFYPQFERWAFQRSFAQHNIVTNGAFANQYRKGSFFDFYDTLQMRKIDEEVLVIASDTLFYPSFSLASVMDSFNTTQSSIVTCYQVSDEKVRSHGILELNQEDEVCGFLEKPGPHETLSRFACPTFYLLTRDAIKEIQSLPLDKESFDSIGKIISYIYPKMSVKAIKIKGRFDIGDLDGYRITNSFFTQIQNKT